MCKSHKVDFQNEVLDVVTVNWDGKLLPAFDARRSKEERLPIVISYGNKEQLIAIRRLENSSGSEQAQAVWHAIMDWNLEDKTQVLCCDTTASNTGRFNGVWKSVDPDKIQYYREEIGNLLDFYRTELGKKATRDDYRELIELSVTYSGGDPERKYKIRPPGAMHQARWMARN